MPLIEKQSLKSLNKAILAVIGLLSIISLVMIYSATSSSDLTGLRYNFFLKQLMWVTVSFFILFFVSQINYEVWIGFSPWMYFITLGMLLLLLFVGKSKFGSVRWFHLGPFAFQPSEFAKVVLVLMLTKFISENKGKIDIAEGMFKTFVLVGAPMFLILIQPDLGTTLIFIPIVFFMLFIKVRLKSKTFSAKPEENFLSANTL